MPINYQILIHSAMVFQALFFIVAFTLVKRYHRPGLIPLLGVGLGFLLGGADDLWQMTGMTLYSPNWVFTGGLISLLLGPFIYFYVNARTENHFGFAPIMLLHCLWLLPLTLFLWINWWPLNAEEKVSLLVSGELESLTTLLLIPIYGDGILILYLFLSVQKLRLHGIRLQEWFSNIEDRNLSAIRYLLILFTVMIVMHLIWTIGRYFLFENQLSAWIAGLLTSYHFILLNGLFLEFGTYPYADGEAETPELQTLEESTPQQPRSPIPGQERLIDRLKQLIENERLYLDPNLTITDLARPLRVHPRTLSQLINQSQECNFHEFINHYRIEHAKTEIVNHPQKAILQVAYDSGFNSKSAFNTAFKRFVLLTPTGFRRSLIGNQN